MNSGSFSSSLLLLEKQHQQQRSALNISSIFFANRVIRQTDVLLGKVAVMCVSGADEGVIGATLICCVCIVEGESIFVESMERGFYGYVEKTFRNTVKLREIHL